MLFILESRAIFRFKIKEVLDIKKSRKQSGSFVKIK